MFGRAPRLRRRLLNTAFVLAVNLALWVGIPYYLGTILAGLTPATPITVPLFVYEFGLAITLLQMGSALAEGRLLWVPFTTAASVAVAIYLWAITNGGVITVLAGGASITLEFRVLLYLILVPVLWPAVRAPASYLMFRRAHAADAELSPLP